MPPVDPNTLPRSDDTLSLERSPVLMARDSQSTVVPGKGAVDPNNINMQGMMALFAIIGAIFVLGSIWFFFWAKNGGFVWRRGDWDEYKSTVLRRKGPDGKTLSNATASTNLGGGSVVGRGYRDDDGYTVTDSVGYTVDETATTVSEKPRKKKFRETAKEKLLRRRKDEKWEGGGDDDMRAYRHERPARVGGLNREADGIYHGTDYTETNPPTEWTASEVSQKQEHQREPRQRDPSGYSFTAGSEDVISSVASEARPPRRHRHSHRHSRTSQNYERERERRQHDRATERSSRQSSPRKRERSSMPGGYTEPIDFASTGTNSEYQYSQADTDGTGTKSYHHPIPGLTKGYRRDTGGRRRRRDSLSESDGE